MIEFLTVKLKAVNACGHQGAEVRIQFLWGPDEGQLADSALSELPHEHLHCVNNLACCLGATRSTHSIQVTFES